MYRWTYSINIDVLDFYSQLRLQKAASSTAYRLDLMHKKTNQTKTYPEVFQVV